VSVLSVLKNTDVRPDVAVTGEITLRGKVLKVDGLKQKCLAAHQAGVSHVVIPRANESELSEVPEMIRNELQIHLVSRVNEALDLALSAQPAPPAAHA